MIPLRTGVLTVETYFATGTGLDELTTSLADVERRFSEVDFKAGSLSSVGGKFATKLALKAR